MSLTICPDCENKISTSSEHCIYCGCPALFYRDGSTYPPDKKQQKANESCQERDNMIPQLKDSAELNESLKNLSI